MRSTLRLDVPRFSLRTSRILPVVCGEHLLSAKQMRPGQPPDRIVRGFLPAESPIGVEMTASARQRSNRVPRLPTRVADPSSCDPESALATLASSRPCSEEHGGGGGRNAQATSRARARFLGSPRQFTLENHRCRWLCRNHPASSGTLTFLCIHSQPDRRAPQHKNRVPL